MWLENNEQEGQWWKIKTIQTMWAMVKSLDFILNSMGNPWKFKQGIESESEVAQLCPALCNPMDCSLPGSSVQGILQARILEWVVVSFSNPTLYFCFLSQGDSDWGMSQDWILLPSILDSIPQGPRPHVGSGFGDP